MSLLHALQNTLAWLVLLCSISILLFLVVGLVGLAVDWLHGRWHNRITRKDYGAKIAAMYPRDHSAEARQLRDVAARMAARDYQYRTGRRAP